MFTFFKISTNIFDGVYIRLFIIVLGVGAVLTAQLWSGTNG